MRALFCILIASFFIGTLHSQVYDSIEFKKIQLNGVPLGTHKDLLVKKLGKPQKVVTTEDGRGKDSYSDYHYLKSSIRVSPAGIMNGFTIKDDRFVLRYNQLRIRTGDTVQLIEKKFPNSAKSFAKDIGGKFRLKIKASNSYIVCKIVAGLIKEMEIKDEIE